MKNIFDEEVLRNIQLTVMGIFVLSVAVTVFNLSVIAVLKLQGGI